MSKQGKRKITVELPKTKELTRPSVFERLGTKKTSAKKTSEHCRQWAQHGSCAYGKSCKFASSHTLISPSKQRAANKDSDQKRISKDDPKNRLHSTIVVRSCRSPEGDIDNWDQNDLDALEKRRLQLQRELELQMKMDSSKIMRKDMKKAVSSSSSSRSSSSSSISSSSSGGSSSSSSEREARRKGKKGKLKRNSSSSDGDLPSKKKYTKTDSLKRDKNEIKKPPIKKDDRLLQKKPVIIKKKINKPTLVKKSLSPGKKSGGTPPITLKNPVKSYSGVKHGKSPPRREKNRSVSPLSNKDRDKDRDRGKDKERDKERDKDRNRGRSRSNLRSHSPRRNDSHPKDPRRKDSSERNRPISPKKQVRREASSDRHRKQSGSRDRDRNRDLKDRSLERRKDKHDEKERHDRKDRLDRGRERVKDIKREDSKRKPGRERGLGRGGSDKGLEKPNKPMERLLPRPEERLAALAAISNKVLEVDKPLTNSKDRQDTHSEHGGRKQDRNERDRSGKREHLASNDREQGEYDGGMDRQYEHGHPIEHYNRVDDRYDDGSRENERSPGYGMQSRERRYDSSYEMPGPPQRVYPEDEERMYNDHIGDHRGGVDMGYDSRRPHRDRSWEGRSGSIDRERGYSHPHKEWEGEDYHAGGDWNRERHWPIHEPQNEWADKEPEMESWHHRGHPPGPHRPRVHDDYNRPMRLDMARSDANKRRPQRIEPEPVKEAAPQVQTPQQTIPIHPEPEVDDKPIPDDLSEISDDPDDILNQEDMVDQTADEDNQVTQLSVDENMFKSQPSELQSTQEAGGLVEEKESHLSKDEEDVANLDFEEISDGELEEERTRAGLGDALGVDWASLVADVRRREQVAPTGGARDRWRPEQVLTRLGISVQMAGRETVQSILDKTVDTSKEDSKIDLQGDAVHESDKSQNGSLDNAEEKAVQILTVDSLHPVAVVQIAIEKRKRQRAALFGSGCEITRALCARRDLALRRHLCYLPPVERSGQSRVTPQPSLFHAARALLMQTTISS